MTWRITRIYAAARALPFLMADPILAPHLFILKRNQQCRELPEEGLVCVDLDSFDFDGELAQAAIQSTLIPEHVVDTRKVGKMCYKKESKIHLTDMPSKNQLRYIQHIARLCPETLVYYRHETLAGTNEIEYAWIFDGRTKKQYIYVMCGHSKPLKVVIKPDTLAQKVQFAAGRKTVLQKALKKVGVGHPIRCFAPHSRGFDLRPYAVTI